MRAPINLATTPFRKDRPVFVASITGTAALAVLLAVLILTIVSERNRAASTREAIDRLNQQLNGLIGAAGPAGHNASAAG